MALKPTASLYVQTGEADADGEADAFIIPFPDAANQDSAFAQATIAHSTAKEGVSTDCNITLSGIKYSDIAAFRAQGYVRIEAGYLDSEDVPPRTVFFGKYKDTTYTVDDGKKLWTLHVDAQPFEIASVPVRFSEKNILVGKAVEKVYERLGIVGKIAPLLYGDTLDSEGNLAIKANVTPTTPIAPDLVNAMTIPEWNPQGRPAFLALNDLILYARAAIQDQYGVNRRIALVPDTTQGFTYNIIDLDSSEPFQVLDIDTAGGLVLGGGPQPMEEQAYADIDQGAVSEGETAVVEEETPAVVDPSALTTVKRRRYSLVTVFDPRITIGTVVNVIDAEVGETPFMVTDVRHNLAGGIDGWRTECEGDVLDGVFAFNG